MEDHLLARSYLFLNGDGCGDIHVLMGESNVFQMFNVLSNICYIIHGYIVFRYAKCDTIQFSGFCFSIIGICSTVYHSTSKSCGFLMDILGIIIFIISLLYNSLLMASYNKMNTIFACKKKMNINITCLLVGIITLINIHYAMEFHFSSFIVWYIWVFHAAIIVFTSIFILLHISFKKNILNRSHFIKIARMLMYLIIAGLFTQIIHYVCKPMNNYETIGVNISIVFPFHSIWHLFSSISGYILLTLMDDISYSLYKTEL